MKIRPAEIGDKEFIISLLPRLVEFNPPPWRTPEQMTAGDTRVLERVLSAAPPPGTAVFIAEGDDGTPLGFVHLNTAVDYYTEEKHGHISDIAVALAGEGRGVGRALMQVAEDWACGLNFRLLTLSVFAQNKRARELYEKLGYGTDTIKYVKELR